jgi:hypothetical protein
MFFLAVDSVRLTGYTCSRKVSAVGNVLTLNVTNHLRPPLGSPLPGVVKRRSGFLVFGFVAESPAPVRKQLLKLLKLLLGAVDR